MLRNTPYTNFHNLNLDWIMRKLKLAVYAVNGQPPDEDGNVELEITGGVNSVNGKTGDVELTAADVDALPDSYTPPVQSVNGQTGNVVVNTPNIQTGISDALTVNAQTVSNVLITFPTEFNATPRFVMAQLYASPLLPTNKYEAGELAVFETQYVSKSAAVFRIANAGQQTFAPDNQYPIYIKWLAIE